MTKKLSKLFSVAMVAAVALPAVVSAHVVVAPAEVGVGKRQVFSVGVPNESDTAQVSGVRLVIPEGLESVRPNVKPGWTIEIKKSGEGEKAKVTEIIWTGGSVPVDQRDEFLFQAKAPAKENALNWKAYETYSDGKVVSWDQEPKEGNAEGSKPYSVTKVVNDLGANKSAEAAATPKDDNRANLALGAAVIALLASIATVVTCKK